MDPNEALKQLRHYVNHLLTPDNQERACEAFNALDQWLSNGGFLPADWSGDRFTRADVAVVVNAGVDMVVDELSQRERDTDLLNLVVNTVLTRLDNPEASLDDVIEKNYDGEDPRTWWDFGTESY
jgi:hypothetical protein